MQLIEIWQPRYHDKTVLIAKHKVGMHNMVIFTMDKTLSGAYYLPYETIKKYPLESNGKIPCYVVPLSELEPYESH